MLLLVNTAIVISGGMVMMSEINPNTQATSGGKNNIGNIYVNSAIGTVFLYAWSLVTRSFAFQTRSQLISDWRILYIPVAYLVLLYAQRVWLRRKERPVSIALKAFCIYEILNCIIWLLIYPGAWKWDEINIFNEFMRTGDFNYWQHYLTILFYIFALFFAPFPAGIVLVWFTVISVIFGYLTYVLARVSIGRMGKWKYFLLVPFFSIPVFNYNMWPLRLSMYCILELLLVVLIIEPKIADHADIWSRPWRCLVIAILTALLANWRSEAILYFVMIPILMYILYPGKRHIMKCGVMLACCAVATLAVSLPQVGGIGSNKDYKLSGMLHPLSPLIARAEEEQQTEILSEMDKVLNIDTMLEGYRNGIYGVQLYWSNRNELIRDGFTESDYKLFLRDYAKLIMRYPDTFLRDRLELYLDGWKLPESSIGWLYTTDNESVYLFAHSYFLNRPLSNDLRVKVGNILNSEGDAQRLTIWMRNYYLQTITLVAFTIWLAIKRSRYVFVALVMEVRIVLTFLTAPYAVFMYYYNVWLFGTIILCGAAALVFDRLYKAGKRKRSATL